VRAWWRSSIGKEEDSVQLPLPTFTLNVNFTFKYRIYFGYFGIAAANSARMKKSDPTPMDLFGTMKPCAQQREGLKPGLPVFSWSKHSKTEKCTK
jgi:hypothetical protein